MTRLTALANAPWLAPYKPFLRKLLGYGGPDDQWCRIVMNRETERLVAGLEPAKRSVLEISGNKWNRPGYFRSYRSADYPEYDVCAGALPEKFDLVIAEQVFEHLLWPYRAARHVREMINPGGAFLVSTPFLIRLHREPYDCTRWTETGMKHLLAEAGFPIEHIETGAWGNRACVKANFSKWQKIRFWHSLKNEADYPLVVWALARVPE
ncbi:MAG TPA: methyltransferase domain-containing protein [Pirellulales bacterium]